MQYTAAMSAAIYIYISLHGKVHILGDYSVTKTVSQDLIYK